MIVHTCTQGTTEWLRLRAGIPTASRFGDIITPKTLKPSASATGYLYDLLAERMLGRPLVRAVTLAMQRGSETEAEARHWYEGRREVDVVQVGFCTNDAGTIGASPDGLVGEDGLVEIKCHPEAAGRVVQALLTGEASSDYTAQAQGQLWILERQWVDLLNYHPELPPALVRVERDEKFIAALVEHVGAFVGRLGVEVEKCRARGWILNSVEDVGILAANPYLAGMRP